MLTMQFVVEISRVTIARVSIAHTEVECAKVGLNPRCTRLYGLGWNGTRISRRLLTTCDNCAFGRSARPNPSRNSTPRNAADRAKRIP